MTKRDWVLRKLQEPSGLPLGVLKEVEGIGQCGLRIRRHERPEAVVYCPEFEGGQPFSAEDLRCAVADLPGLDMVVLVRGTAEPETYRLATELGVAIEHFSDLVKAIINWSDVSEYVHSEENYIRSRLTRTGVVTSVIRCGYRAWHLQRSSGLPRLTVVCTGSYEVTDDELTLLHADYASLEPNVIIVTNPNTRGLGTRVLDTAQRLGTPLVLLNDFVTRIHEPWT
jgi:hypothetical protein